MAAFVNAWRATRRGDHHQAQRMFRARVLAQGFTVVAMCAGGIYLADERRKERELWKLHQRQNEEEQRQKWIRELEARDEEDKAVKALIDRRRKRAEERAKGKDAVDGEKAAEDEASRAEKDDDKTVLGAWGTWYWGKGGVVPPEEKEGSAEKEKEIKRVREPTNKKKPREPENKKNPKAVEKEEAKEPASSENK